ncbi:hypothetical protein CC79DRAFT_169901 [Sarocladium strictum]
MGLVDYSDSEGSGSEAEAPKPPPKPTQKAASSSKKPFQKVVDRSNPGKILVNLPTAGANTTSSGDGDEPPPAKRARTAGGGRFSGFNSFLPPPKNPNAKPTGGAFTGAQGKPKPGVNLRTSAAPGFSRDEPEGEDGTTAGSSEDATGFPAPKAQAEPSIPEGQKAAEDVKITGKPLMFKPLSVSRKPIKKKAPKTDTPPQSTLASAPSPSNGSPAPASVAATEPPPKKKTSLFSVHVEEPSEPKEARKNAYEPFFSTNDDQGTHADSDVTGDYNSYVPQDMPQKAATTESLDTVIDGMNLSAAARRELFGREGAPRAGLAASRVVNFNMDTEYQHNEEIRAAGDQQMHNPVRAIQGGKHNLRQLVRNVQDQKDALEESFAKGKTNRKEASSKYGW